MDEEIKRRLEDIRTRLGGNEDFEFLLLEFTQLELKLIAADILAMTTDVAVQRGILDSRSLIADARLNYGGPWKYEYATREDLLGYRGGIPEVKEALNS